MSGPVPMLGKMMERQLLISSVITHAARHHGATQVVSRLRDRQLHRYSYVDCEARSRRLASALTAHGVHHGDRVATLAWNGYRHMELYFAVSGSGAVCHTINPRLAEQQIAYIIGHAEDRYVCFDLDFLPLIESLAPRCGGVERWICMTDRDSMPTGGVDLACYEQLIEEGSHRYEWPDLDERSAASLCYTSGTTGEPKGALYSHRSTILHAYASALPDSLNCSARDVISPIVPMFHANAWGIPYAAPMVGAKLVLPGAHLDGGSVHALFEQEGVTFSAGVPTVWLGLLEHVRSHDLQFRTLKRVVVGGAALAPALASDFASRGVEAVHAWGMTELSPMGTVGLPLAKHTDAAPEERQTVLAKQGRGVYGIDMKIARDDGTEIAWDGITSGNLLVRGHWVVETYFNSAAAVLQDGWFPTGDVGTIDPDGYLQITDRSKDVIKSGGEWISSIALESGAAAHPGVQMAACIGCPHTRWGERPLLVVVKKPGIELTREELLNFLRTRFPKWWIPDDVVFVDEIPLTATGKMQKRELKERYHDFRFPEG